MATKPKTLYVPALNKGTTKKPKKSSVRELGSAANNQYKAGSKATTSPSFGPKKGQEMPERNFGRYRVESGYGNDPTKYDPTYTGPGKKPKKGTQSYYQARKILARQTGMAKGGLVTKKKGK